MIDFLKQQLRIGGMFLINPLGTYKAFIDAVNEIGKEYKDRIYREFLGIEPPPASAGEGKL